MGDDKSIHIKGSNFGTNITGDHNIVNQSAPHIIPKKLTPQIGLANDIDFVGRKEELQKVDELLNQNSMLLLLNGIGGIGKSTLASYYLNQHNDNFDYYGFVQVNEDIKLSLASAFGISLDLKSEKIDDLFAEIMNKLQNLEGKKLLIIDDVKDMDNQLDEMNTLMTLKNSGFQILFTSRETKEYILQYFLDIMSVEDARELFLKHYPTDEIDKVDKILEYLDYHTLFIEITAKTLTKRKNTLSLDIAIEKFENGEFSTVKINKSESFNKFLKNFSYDSVMLTQKKNLLFLKRLSVLPSIKISFEDLYKFLVCDDRDKLEDFLIELIDNGWLIESEHAYKFHQILKEFVFDNYLPSFEEIDSIFSYFSKEIKDSADILTALNNRENIIYLDSLQKILDEIGVEKEVVALFTLDFANLYDSLGEYKKAEQLFLKAIKINEKLLGEEHLDTAGSYNNLALLYWSIMAVNKAKPLFIKALKIREKLLGEEHPDTATSYNNLALLYKSMGNYKKAELLYLKDLKISEKLLGEEHLDTVKSYNNLAELYRSMENYEKAEQLFIKALKIKEKLLGEEHPSTAIGYNNLALLYKSMGEDRKVEPLHLKALKIKEKLLGKEHPSTAKSYRNLAVFYYGQNNFSEALKYIKKAINILQRVFPENHPDLINSKEGLRMINEKL